MGAGRYIVFEGAEGCGKSTHAAKLAKTLDAVVTRETGGTDVGAAIRAILHDTANTHLCDRSEALLTAADRAQHLAQIVRPTLARGQHVVSDRSVYSTLAYQGYGRGLDLGELRSINDWAIEGLWPDLVILLEVPQDQLAQRMSTRELDRFEQAEADFHRRVAKGFAEMAANDPQRWVVIDASRARSLVGRDIRSAVHDRLGMP